MDIQTEESVLKQYMEHAITYNPGIPYEYNRKNLPDGAIIKKCTVVENGSSNKKQLNVVDDSGNIIVCQYCKWHVMRWGLLKGHCELVLIPVRYSKKVPQVYKIERIISVDEFNSPTVDIVPIGSTEPKKVRINVLLNFLLKHVKDFGKIGTKKYADFIWNRFLSPRFLFSLHNLCWSQAMFGEFADIYNSFSDIALEPCRRLVQKIGICNDFPIGSITLYSHIKKAILDNKGSYCLLQNLPNHKQEILKYLEQNDVVVRIENRIFIKKLHNQEKLIQQYFASETLELNESLYDLESVKEGLCSEQYESISKFLCNKLTLLNGAAGSGKTSVIKRLVTEMPMKSLVLAYQGQNVYNIQKDIPSYVSDCQFSTIHYLLEYPDDYFDKNVSIKKCMIFIDEVSLLTPELLCRLIIKSYEKDYQVVRWILSGDMNQLAPMGNGDLFRDLCNAFPDNVVKFEHNHRIKHKPMYYIEPLFHSILGNSVNSEIFGTPPILDVNLFDNQHTNFFTRLTDVNRIGRLVTGIFRTRPELNLKNTHVISRLNKDVDTLNLALADYFTRGPNFVKGAKVLFKKNFHDTQIRTNVIYIITRITQIVPSDMTLQSEILKEIPLLEKNTFKKGSVTLFLYSVGSKEHFSFEMKSYQWSHIKLGYATTVHAALGQQFSNIIYVQTKSSQYETKEVVYTAFSRAMDKRFFIGTIENLCKSISTSDAKRPTRLGVRDIVIHTSNDNDEEDYDDFLDDVDPDLIQKREAEIVLSRIFKTLPGYLHLITDILELLFITLYDSRISLKMNIRNLIACASVCKQWREVINTKRRIWDTFLQSNKGFLIPITGFINWFFTIHESLFPFIKPDTCISMSMFIPALELWIAKNASTFLAIRRKGYYVIRKYPGAEPTDDPTDVLNTLYTTVFYTIDEIGIEIKEDRKVYLKYLSGSGSLYEPPLIKKEVDILLNECSLNKFKRRVPEQEQVKKRKRIIPPNNST